MFCYIPFLCFIVSTLQKCTKSPSIPLLVSAGAHPGLRWRRFGLVPQLAAQTCSLQLLTPQLTASPGCSALPEGCSGNSRLWAYLLSQAKPAPKPGPGAEHLLPILTPKGSCQCFLGRARLGELCALELQHRAVAGLISLWNSTETKGLSAVRRKACRRAVRMGILRTTHEWKKENGNLFNEPLCFVI